MFDSPNYPKPLSEDIFESWLENGRTSKIGYHYLLVIWNVYDEQYQPLYLEDREAIEGYELYPNARGAEALIAAYDLYSEARISI
ncbi:hypothetical protein J0A68_07885 [Algoriphagus sp. H41]|uniref:Uncharacterized protein n=1 Tax=Algoriphagus oliviformis TaxID=2811231 RepID=A0ABS3C2N4_9BACT|nr:hypothetical protein [Algoriphagus oliviformis]MBN7810869.1 hypothetical protein [Algoriphagus oliviformis]